MWDGQGIEPGLYDHLIDAEREALSRSGRRVNKIALIKALREASGLGLSDAKRAVEGYLAREGDLAPRKGGGSATWIDDLLDAERAAASKEERPVTKILLIKALRGASPGLGLAEAKRAVEGYLRRRGGEGLPTGGGQWLAVLAVALAAVALAALMLLA